MQNKTRGLIQINIAVLLFSLAGLFGKFMATPAIGLVFGRTLCAALALALILVWKKKRLALKNRERICCFLHARCDPGRGHLCLHEFRRCK